MARLPGSASTPSIPSTELKTTAEGLTLQSTATGIQRKYLLFKKVLKEEFLRELEYLWDVANNRATPRDTMAKIIVDQLKNVTPYLPVVGSGVTAAVEQLGAVAVFAANRVRDERTGTLARLQDELDLHHLGILLDLVAEEAWRRYEHFITHRLSHQPDKGVIPFARVGARRMLERLSRSSRQQDDKIVVEVNESTLLAGLMEGRSGTWIEGFSNHTLELQQTKGNLFNQEVSRTISAEDVYARPGLRHIEIQGKALVDQLYIREKAKHQELPEWKKAFNLLKGDTEAFYSFGFVRFRTTTGYRHDPRASYVSMPLAVIQGRYDFKPQDRKALSAELQTELAQSSPSILSVSRTTILWYVTWLRTSAGQGKSLVDYVKNQLKCPTVVRVICHDDLSGLDLKGANLSHTDLSGAILSGDLTGTQFSHSYLIGATLKNITSLRGASFYQARCEFLSAEGINFSGADLTQAQFDYARLHRAQFTGCKTLGAQWRGADLREMVSDTELLFEQKTQMTELKQTLAQQRQRLRDVYRLMQQQAESLCTLHQQLAKKVTAMGDRLGAAEENQRILNQLGEQVQRLIEQQTNTLAFQTHCQEEMTQLRSTLDQAVDPVEQKQLKSQLQALQCELREIKESKEPLSLAALQERAIVEPVFQEEVKRLETQLNQTLTQQRHAQSAAVQQLVGSLQELQQAVEKRLEEKLSGLAAWANQTYQALQELRVEHQSTQQHLTTVQQELQQLQRQQQIYQNEQKQYQQELAALRGQLEQGADQKTLVPVRERLQALEEKLAERAVDVTDEKSMAAQFDTLQNSCLDYKAELEKLVSEHGELRAQHQAAIDTATHQAAQFEQLKQELLAQQTVQRKQNETALVRLKSELSAVQESLTRSLVVGGTTTGDSQVYQKDRTVLTAQYTSQDAKKQLAAESLMTPIAVTGPIASALKDSHFTQKLFADPVITATGDTYEREQIETWLKDHDTNPLDNERLEDKILRPNKAKLREVNEFLEQNASLRNSDELYLPRSWVKELEQACMEGKLEVIKRWCDRDPRLGSWTFSFEEKEYEAYRGKTMLHLVCAKGTLEAVGHLLALEEKRAEGLSLLLLLKKDSTGKLPIHYTMTPDRDPQMMRQLAAQMGKHLADVAPVDLPTMPGEKQRQMTALHLAAMSNDVETIKTLLARQVDLTVKDGQGNTALHAAMACGAVAKLHNGGVDHEAVDVVRLLIEAGAAMDVENDAGQTAEQVGLACGQETAVLTLRHCIALLAQRQQTQLQQAGSVGIALLQMQQVMEQLQSIVNAQAAEIQELQATIEEQNKVIRHQHAEQMAHLEQKESKESLVLHAELRGQRAVIEHVEQQVKEFSSSMRDSKVWEPVPFVKTPAELRKALAAKLLANPFAQDIKIILHDTKENKSVLKKETVIYDKFNFSKLVGTLPDGRLVAAYGGSQESKRLIVMDMIHNKKVLLPGVVSTWTGLMITSNGRQIVGELVQPPRSSVPAVWDIEQQTCQELKYINEPTCARRLVTALTDGRLLVSYHKMNSSGKKNSKSEYEYDFDSKINLIDTINQRSTTLIQTNNRKLYDFYQCLTVSPDNQLLITDFNSSDFNSSLAVFEIASGKHLVTLAESEVKDVRSNKLNWYGFFKHLTITTHGYVAGFKADDAQYWYLRTWDIKKGTCISSIKLSQSQPTSLLALPNGFIVSSTWGGPVQMWDVEKGSCTGLAENGYHFDAALLVDGRMIVNEQGRYCFSVYDHVGGCAIELNLRFCARFLESDPSWTVGADHIQIKTSFPCESELKALSTLLETACPDHQLTMALTSTSLTITGLNTELRSDLEGLCQALSIPKAIPGAQATMSGIASLLSRPGGLYAPLPTLSGRPVSGVTTPTTDPGVSSSSTSASSSTTSSSQVL